MDRAIRDRLPPRQFNEAFLISLPNRFVFARMPKVANSTLKHLIYSMEKMPWGRPIRDDLIHDSHYGTVTRPAMLGFSSQILHDALFSDQFFRFTVVRNPYAKTLSGYLDRYMSPNSSIRRIVNKIAAANGWLPSQDGDVTFSTYLRAIGDMPTRHMEVHVSPQVTQSLHDLVSYHFTGAFETLAADMQHVARTLWDRDDADLGFKSPSRTDATSRLREFYGADDIALVNRIYKRDFDAFGYPMVDSPGAFSDPDAIFRRGA